MAVTRKQKRKDNPFRPGTASYAKRRTELKQQELNRASRIASQTANPETRQRATTRATRARTTIKKIETLEKARSEYGKSNKVEFSRKTIREQIDIVRQAKEVEQLITPEGFPKDIHVEVSEKNHNLLWALAYNEYRSKAGNSLRA
jgi:hypothetical protein